MLVNKLVFVGALASMALSIQTANAAEDCPGIFSGEPCNGGTGIDNCTRVDDGEVECDLRPATQGVNAFFVSPSNTDFQGYGFDGAGEEFCCAYDSLDDGCDVGLITVTIYGTDYNDTLRLVDTTAGENLDCSEATVYGDIGNDEIKGSPSTDNDDILMGDAGADVIYGYAGDDVIEGGDGPDYIYGGDDDDTIDGGAGIDHLFGNDGNDTIDGGDGADYIKGGADDDVLHGGPDPDNICGGTEDDDLYGDGDDDIITGETGTDKNDGGVGGIDRCEPDNDVNCSNWSTLDSACTW